MPMSGLLSMMLSRLAVIFSSRSPAKRFMAEQARMPRTIARVWRLQVERGSELLRTALRFLLDASWIASGVMNRSL